MQELQPLKSFGRTKKKRSTRSCRTRYFLRSSDGDDMMSTDAVEVQDVQANSTFSAQIAYYALLFLKVGLWISFAWVLSHLHLGAPCFLLPLILWLYSGPMDRALHWAKRRLRGPAA